jgi:acyl-coenzyme A synthetase/AMP-(fatty) acid ligase
VYFEEVEMVLEQYPQINEAAVCGIVNRLGCEELVAFIVPSAAIPSTDDFVSGVKAFLQERIGRHKVPQAMFIVECLPRHSTGKLSRQGIERMLHDV